MTINWQENYSLRHILTSPDCGTKIKCSVINTALSGHESLPDLRVTKSLQKLCKVARITNQVIQLPIVQSDCLWSGWSFKMKDVGDMDTIQSTGSAGGVWVVVSSVCIAASLTRSTPYLDTSVSATVRNWSTHSQMSPLTHYRILLITPSFFYCPVFIKSIYSYSPAIKIWSSWWTIIKVWCKPVPSISLSFFFVDGVTIRDAQQLVSQWQCHRDCHH